MKKIYQATSLAIVASMILTQAVLAQTTSELPVIQHVTPASGSYFPASTQTMQTTPFIFPSAMAPAPLKGQVSIIPSGTTFNVKVNDEISTKTAKLGQIFAVNIDAPVVINGKELIQAGSEAIGQVTYVKPAARMANDAELEIKFTKVKLSNGQTVPMMGKIATVDKTGILKGGNVKNQLIRGTRLTTTGVAGGALAGVTIGAMASHATTGAIVGTAVGGVAGVGWFLGKKGKEIVLSSGTDVVVTLEQPLTVGQ